MAKFILSMLFSVLMLGSAAVSVSARPEIEMIDTELQTVTISVVESAIHVTGGNGMTMTVYKITGDCIVNVKVDGNDKRYDFNLPKGCYIVQVGKVVRKIVISK